MSRRTVAVTVFLTAAAAFGAIAPDAGPAILPPTTITLKQADATLADAAVALAKASGVQIVAEPEVARTRCPISFNGTPLWDALDKAARDAGARLVVADGGQRISFARRAASKPEIKEVTATSGPFRVVVKTVTGRLLLETGATVHELQLLVHWEPRYAVYRIDSSPRILAAKFDRTNDLIPYVGSSRHHPAGALTEMTVRLAGVTRRAARIDVLAGEFRATAARKMLTLRFDNLATTTPIEQKTDGITARMKPFIYDETTKTWDVDLELVYPPGGPEFESFEEHKWLRDNRIQLVSPEGKPLDPDSEDVVASGKTVNATYRFKGANPKAKGWSLVYVVPGPLVEVTVPFKLENIPLP